MKKENIPNYTIDIKDNNAVITVISSSAKNTNKILIDIDDLDKIKGGRIHINNYSNTSYATISINNKTMLIHRYIKGLNKYDKEVIDHINGNGLDNRKSNLRIVTQAVNLFNRHNNPKRYYYDKTRNKYYIRFKYNKRYVRIGSFNTEKECIDELRILEKELLKLHL